MHRQSMMAACVVCAGLVGGCGERSVNGPPNTRLGRDVCAECDMIVSDDRYAAGAVIRKEGRLEHAHYDDIGCLLDHARFHPDIEFVEEYVRDSITRQWVRAAGASFVMSEQVHTPMASGIAGFATLEAAGESAGGLGVKVQAWDEVRASRREWMESRYGKPALPGGDGPGSK
ncbi:MAG: hypothetical protein AMXMBFR58_16880 [Phycisphaerae bacterium]